MVWHALHGKIVLCNAMTLDCYCLYIERAVSWKATEILYCGDRCVHARHARITKVLIREPVLLEPPHLPRTHRASKSCLLQHGGAPKVVMCHCNLWTCDMYGLFSPLREMVQMGSTFENPHGRARPGTSLQPLPDITNDGVCK